jgi:hypothetical protein
MKTLVQLVANSSSSFALEVFFYATVFFLTDLEGALPPSPLSPIR